MLKSDDILANRYRLILLVGQGTMGAVYDAEDLVFHRRVALKQMRDLPEASERVKQQTRAQFEREAKILATLRHPNLPRVTDFFTLDDQQFLVMDYIEGQSLEEILQFRQGGLEEGTVLEWADQLLSALIYIHRHGLVHRDVKPANIRVTPDDHVFLVDFGLVKTFDPESPKTATAVRGLGTPQYAPPEQYDVELGHTEPRSDLYSLGATMYHLLTGEAPPTVTRRVSSPQSFRAVRELCPTVSPDVERVVTRAMEVNIAKRFASATDMQQALQLARAKMDLGRTGTLPAAELRRTQRQQRRRRLETAAGLLVMLGLVIMAFIAASPPSPIRLTPTSALPTSTATLSTESDLPVVISSSTATLTPTPTRTATATRTATPSATATASATATDTPTASPSPTLRRITATFTPTEVVPTTAAPTATEKPERGNPPTKAPTAEPPTPELPTATRAPTNTPPPPPTEIPTSRPTLTPGP